jgi:hypothetical protein
MLPTVPYYTKLLQNEILAFFTKNCINPKKLSQLYGGTDPVGRAGEGKGWDGPGPLRQEGVEGGVPTAHHHQALPRHHA